MHTALPFLLFIDMLYGFPTINALNEIWFDDIIGPILIVDVELLCWFSQQLQ